jgi:membrane protein involved in colicin uptake
MFIDRAKAVPFIFSLVLSGSTVNGYAASASDTAKTLGVLGGIGGAIAVVNVINSQQEAAKQDEILQKQLENQIKEEQEKIIASEKRMQDMQQYDQQFFSSSKQQQYEYLKKSELDRQANIKKETAGVNIISALFGAVTAPRDYFYDCR